MRRQGQKDVVHDQTRFVAMARGGEDVGSCFSGKKPRTKRRQWRIVTAVSSAQKMPRPSRPANRSGTALGEANPANKMSRISTIKIVSTSAGRIAIRGCPV